MVINIIDRDFNFLGKIDQFESFISSKKWHGIGDFELHLHKNNAYANKLVKENIIFTTENKAYVILHREISSIDGKMIVKGKELKSYLARWLIFPPEGYSNFRINSNIETIMKEYVQATLNRKGITNIVVAENKNRGVKTVYQSRYKNLADELEKLSLASNLSWDIVLDLDNKRFVFDVVEDRNVTVNQDLLPPAIFSIDYDNIGEQKLIESRANYANTAIVAGQGEGADRAITIVGESKGLDSFELFVDARDLENDADLPFRGEQKLAEVQEIFTFDSEVLTDKNLVYEKDFKLGDVVTIQNSEWDISVNRRITELTEIYESSGFRLDVVFGEPIPTLIDMVKKATDTPVVEGGSEGEQGLPGTPGKDGVGLEYRWNGTELGIKREDEAIFDYMNLEGPQGLQGKQGVPGLDGKSLEFHWDGTKLGVRIEGEATFQYVNLKGDKGEQGVRGLPGLDGKSLEYNWNGTQLGIRIEGQSSYQYVDLQGQPGKDGKDGEQGPPGTTSWSGIADKPSTFPPASHNHDAKYRNIIAYYVGGGGIDPNNTTYSYIVSSHANTPEVQGVTFWHIQTFFYSSTTGNRAQIAQSYNGPSHLFIRRCVSDVWSDWIPLATEPYVDSKISGSSGTTIITSATEPTNLNVGDEWHREV